MHRVRAERRGGCASRRAHARPEYQSGSAMNAPGIFRFVSSVRRVREDRRFVAGKGRYVGDVALPGTLHVALVSSPHPAARIVSIDKSAALAMPGVRYVVDGDEIAGATAP